MRLTDFIMRNMDRIIEGWEAFAATRLPAAASMRPLELRDHARQILDAIVIDLGTPQTREQQASKSKGLAPTLAGAETAAQTHAILRAKSGFDIMQLASEYRALRASVLRLWMDDCAPGGPDLDDLMRFNEAIDQALAESIAFFHAQVERARNLILGMLGHDMRTPLQTIQLTALALGQFSADERVSSSAERLIASGARIRRLLDDLLDFNRTELGVGIRVVREPIDLKQVCEQEIESIRAAYPERRIDCTVIGDCRGSWDAGRLQQVVSNLVVNALKHGAPGTAVHVDVTGAAADVRIEVRNTGRPIDARQLRTLFAPLVRGTGDTGDPSDMGLGLYIVNEVVKAHGGEIHAESDTAGTVFAVRLPRR
jgi:signal transduction histidine kinase